MCHMSQYVNVLQTSSIGNLHRSEEFVGKLIVFKRLQLILVVLRILHCCHIGWSWNLHRTVRNGSWEGSLVGVCWGLSKLDTCQRLRFWVVQNAFPESTDLSAPVIRGTPHAVWEAENGLGFAVSVCSMWNSACAWKCNVLFQLLWLVIFSHDLIVV